MATLYGVPERPQPKHYREFFSTFEAQKQALSTSATVYVGNLAFTTPEDRIFDLFSRCGPIKRVIMGVNRLDKTPCGFCFVEYEHSAHFSCRFHTHEAAQFAVDYITGLVIDDQVIRVEMDWGFSDGRQYGRAKNGGQVRHYVNEVKNRGRHVDVEYNDQKDHYYRDSRHRRRHEGYDDRGDRGDRSDRRRRRY